MKVSVERVVKASPSAVFALLVDPSRHREIDGSGTVRDAVGGSRRLQLGDVFGMDMSVGGRYRMLNTVVELEEDRRIAWQPRPTRPLLARVLGGRLWRYELTPVEGGTLVRETWDTDQEQHPLLVAPLAPLTRLGMSRTMDRIQRLVEQ